MLGRDEIKKIIPHREPFLFLDEIIEIEEGKRAVGIWRLRPDEYFFKGHFPEYPLLPGVLILEALAQAGAVALLSKKENRKKIALFAGVDNLRFRKEVIPGNSLKLEVEITETRKAIGKGKATAYINQKVAAEGELTFALKS